MRCILISRPALVEVHVVVMLQYRVKTHFYF
jgi:hypothetical protein